MGSLNNGAHIGQNNKLIKHQGFAVTVSAPHATGTAEFKLNTVSLPASGYPVFGTVFAEAGTISSGLSRIERDSDTSVDRKVFTDTGTAAGSLMWKVTRQEGIHTSVTTVKATGVLGANVVFSERKVFWLDSDRTKASGFADWNIFNSAGIAVGASAGVTDTDITPSGTFNSN